MSFMKGDLLTKTRKLVKGLAKSEPAWLKAMEHAPPAAFPRSSGKVEKISLPEDPYIKKFFSKHPDSKHEDAILISSFDPPPARIFGWRVLELKEQGVGVSMEGSRRSNKRREPYSYNYKGPILESRKPEKILSRRKRESFSSFSDHRGQSRKKSLRSWRHDMRPCLPPCARCCSLCSLQRKRHF